MKSSEVIEICHEGAKHVFELFTTIYKDVKKKCCVCVFALSNSSNSSVLLKGKLAIISVILFF